MLIQFKRLKRGHGACLFQLLLKLISLRHASDIHMHKHTQYKVDYMHHILTLLGNTGAGVREKKRDRK